MRPMTPTQMEHQPPRRRGIVHVHALSGAVVAECAACAGWEVKRHSSPAERRTALFEVNGWAHAHAAEHIQEPTA